MEVERVKPTVPADGVRYGAMATWSGREDRVAPPDAEAEEMPSVTLRKWVQESTPRR
jgi:hypothetical protein